MNFRLAASLSIAVISASLFTTSAKACEANTDCSWKHKTTITHKYKHVAHRSLAHKSLAHRHVAVTQVASFRHAVKIRGTTISADRGPVVAMIKAQAPSYGVPTWFALRIAKIESGFNPRARGLAGEYGVFQLKCATARGIGFRGNCAGLLNASTNIRYGLKYLSMAVNASHGNLKLAASKHNGGLGRKRLVPSYVAMVF